MERLWQVCIYLGFRLLNVGLFFGILLGGLMVCLWLAKPLLTSKQRVGVWMVGWIMLYLSLLFTTPSALLHVLPVTLPSLVTPRTMTEPGLSAYLPQYAGPGSYNLAFPGGGVVQIRLTDGICLAIAAVWLLGAAAMVLTMYRGSGRLRRLGMRGEHLEEGHPYYRDIIRTVGIWLCGEIPTSFVTEDMWGRCIIFLQNSLTPRQQELVLRHEANHIRLRHCQIKRYANFALVLLWWNPLIWLAYFQLCRDLELHCDSQTMAELAPEERKEYARTLVELGSGRQLWEAPLCFGECGAAERVKSLVAWKPEKWQKNLLAWGIAALVLLFCFTGSPWEKVLPEDRILFWSEYLGEDARFVEVQEQLMKEKGWLPKELSVIHAWLREEEWGGTVQYELSSGTWREVRYICAPEVRGHFRLYCQERDGAPDLFAYQQLL